MKPKMIQKSRKKIINIKEATKKVLYSVVRPLKIQLHVGSSSDNYKNVDLKKNLQTLQLTLTKKKPK